MKRKQLPGNMLFAANLRRIIEAGDRSINQVGEDLELGGANLGKYLRGERFPGWEMLDRMAKVLGVARADFFDEEA